MNKGSEKKLVCLNRRARHDYEIAGSIEAGIVLKGTEVKSISEGRAQLSDSYGEIEKGEVFLRNCHIAEYPPAGKFNHDPKRDRKLLLKKNEIQRLIGRVKEKGFTLIPLSIYFKKGKIKVEIGLCKGKRKYDKREEIRKKDLKREVRGLNLSLLNIHYLL